MNQGAAIVREDGEESSDIEEEEIDNNGKVSLKSFPFIISKYFKPTLFNLDL
jgi:hypothetical protein